MDKKMLLGAIGAAVGAIAGDLIGRWLGGRNWLLLIGPLGAAIGCWLGYWTAQRTQVPQQR